MVVATVREGSPILAAALSVMQCVFKGIKSLKLSMFDCGYISKGGYCLVLFDCILLILIEQNTSIFIFYIVFYP